MKTIDLGTKPQKMEKTAAKPSNEPYYPSTSIHNLKGVDFDVDDEVILHGVIRSVTINDRGSGETYSCEIDIKKLQTGGKSEGLGKTLDKIQKKKADDYTEDE